jgi:alkaline phosphatase D
MNCSKRTFVPVLAFLLPGILSSFVYAAEPGPPHQATGVKVGEVTHESAIIWVRLTAIPERIGAEGGRPIIEYWDEESGQWEERSSGRRPNRKPRVRFAEGSYVGNLEGAVPGMPGEVRIRYRPVGEADWLGTAWQPVDPGKDFTHQFTLGNLKPATDYEFRVLARAGAERGKPLPARFRTAPAPEDPARVVFTPSRRASATANRRPRAGLRCIRRC